MRSGLTLLAMTEKGLAVAEQIHRLAPSLLSEVVSARDPSVRDDFFDRIAEFCKSGGIPFYERAEAPPPQNSSLAISWRWMLPTSDTELVVFHDSLLPRLRGFNPLVTALINGDEEIGATSLLATDAFDSGDILDQEAVEITYPIRIQEAIEIMSDCYRSLATRHIERLVAGEELRGKAQEESEATFSLWRDELDYRVDWTQDANTIRRFIDATGHPYLGASSSCDGHPALRILEAELAQDSVIENRSPGKVLFIEDGVPTVVCGEGLLRLTEVVDESGRSLLPFQRIRTRFS